MTECDFYVRGIKNNWWHEFWIEAFHCSCETSELPCGVWASPPPTATSMAADSPQRQTPSAFAQTLLCPFYLPRSPPTLSCSSLLSPSLWNTSGSTTCTETPASNRLFLSFASFCFYRRGLVGHLMGSIPRSVQTIRSGSLQSGDATAARTDVDGEGEGGSWGT